MPLIVKETGTEFTPCPEGFHQAVCVDVADLGMKQTAFGPKHKVRLAWETEVMDEETKKPHVVMQTYGLSLHKQANLRKTLESWRAQKFTDEELTGFDLEKLLGANCQVQVVHAMRDEGGVWANVQTVAPLSKGMDRLTPSGTYVRFQDRTDNQSGDTHADNDKPEF